MRWIPAYLILLALILIGSCVRNDSANRFHDGAKGTPTLVVKSTDSPTVQATPTLLRSQRPQSPLRPPVDEWTTYISESGGYTLEVPVSWTVNDSTGRGEWITIRPPVRKRVDGVSVSYLKYEKPEEENLMEWLIRYEEATFGAEFPTYEYEPMLLDTIEGAVGIEALFEFVPDSPYGRGYYLTNGRLVLHIHTMGASDQQAEVLRRIASSVTFHDDAPTSILDLSDPEHPPVHTTIAEYDRMIQIGEEAYEALAVRRNTGDTPTELLTDPEVVDKYERILELHADEIAFSDKNREKWNELLANRAPTPNPTEYAATQEAFQALEDLYNENLAHEATIEALKPTQTPSPVSPLPIPTSTTIPESILADYLDEYPGLKPFVKKSRWDTVKEAMLVWYDPQIWQQTVTDKGECLTLVEDPACHLYLNMYESFGMPYSAQWITEQEWTVLWSWSNRFSYEASQNRNVINARLQLPDDQVYRETNKGQCQLLAEDVLDTASAVPAELLD